MRTIVSRIHHSLRGTSRGISSLGFNGSKSQAQEDNVKNRKKCLRIGILGAAFEMGQPKSGVAQSPNLLIKEMDLVKKLESLGHNVLYYGNLEHIPVSEDSNSFSALNMNNVHEYNRRLQKKVSKILEDDRFCLVIGGDHSIGLGTSSGHTSSHSDSCLLWVDAHADINTPTNSESGNMHGMPVAYQIKELYKEFEAKTKIHHWHQPKLSPDRLAYIGLRSVDPSEVNVLKDLNIAAFYMSDIDELGIKEVVRRALDAINPQRNRSLHVSFDIDSLDPLEAPTTGTPVRGGLTLREGIRILHDCYELGCMNALDLVEVNTHLGDEKESKKTLESAEILILAAFGHLKN